MQIVFNECSYNNQEKTMADMLSKFTAGVYLLILLLNF